MAIRLYYVLYNGIVFKHAPQFKSVYNGKQVVETPPPSTETSTCIFHSISEFRQEICISPVSKQHARQILMLFQLICELSNGPLKHMHSTFLRSFFPCQRHSTMKYNAMWHSITQLQIPLSCLVFANFNRIVFD